jgi:iron-sulfur cluster assembly protein
MLHGPPPDRFPGGPAGLREFNERHETIEEPAPMTTLTESAAAQIRRMMKDQQKDPASVGVRLGVKPSGCSGFSYTIDFDGESADGDSVLEQHGIRLIIDAKSAPYLQDVQVDWAGGLLGSGFKFTNPQATKTCGCGESFSVN